MTPFSLLKKLPKKAQYNVCLLSFEPGLNMKIIICYQAWAPADLYPVGLLNTVPRQDIMSLKVEHRL
jgi:hypothetical protein